LAGRRASVAAAAAATATATGRVHRVAGRRASGCRQRRQCER